MKMIHRSDSMRVMTNSLIRLDPVAAVQQQGVPPDSEIVKAVLELQRTRTAFLTQAARVQTDITTNTNWDTALEVFALREMEHAGTIKREGAAYATLPELAVYISKVFGLVAVLELYTGGGVRHLNSYKFYFACQGMRPAHVHYSGGAMSESSPNWWKRGEPEPADLYYAANLNGPMPFAQCEELVRSDGTLLPIWPKGYAKQALPFMFNTNVDFNLWSRLDQESTMEKAMDLALDRHDQLSLDAQNLINFYL